MNGPELSALTRARLETLIPSRPVFIGAAPDDTPPPRYLLVRTSEGSEAATRSTHSVSIQTPAMWVLSVSMNPDPDEAYDEAAWGASRARAALRNWRPDGEWRVIAEASQTAKRDESLPQTTFTAAEQFSFRSHI